MEATRVERSMGRGGPDALLHRASHSQGAAVRFTTPRGQPQTPASVLALGPECLERLVLVAHTFGRERAPALLEGLAPPALVAAHPLLTMLAARGSPARQARVAQVFGPVPEAASRLRHLMGVASPPLRGELLRRLPPYYRSLFPPEAMARAHASTPALATLAERLIREATR